MPYIFHYDFVTFEPYFYFYLLILSIINDSNKRNTELI